MAEKSVTRADLADVVYHSVSVSRAEAAMLVEHVIAEICNSLALGQSVKLSGFGAFTIRDKAERTGRNPKTGVVVPIEPRRAISFHASPVLKARVNRGS
jgi:integration host factor subunit alpha